ncbi:MAG: type pantothenate kinase [Thermoleophilia bacterium]|nr:type pantothenate kinase [Thermoleophilia bacterium]
MLLAVDIGNTQTVLGLFELDSPPAADPTHRWRLRTQPAATSDEVAATVTQLLALDGVALGEVERLALSSVVPTQTRPWRNLAARMAGERAPTVVGPGLRTGLRIATSEPHEVGGDRIVNAVAAWERYGCACIVADLGTATTLDVVDGSGAYIGGAIAPGLAISVEALVARAARLATVDLHVPARAIGRDTADAVRSGTLLGAVAHLEGLAARLRAELVADHGVPAGTHIPMVATGGWANVLGPHVTGLDAVDPDLTLRGLQLLALHR